MLHLLDAALATGDSALAIAISTAVGLGGLVVRSMVKSKEHRESEERRIREAFEKLYKERDDDCRERTTHLELRIDETQAKADATAGELAKSREESAERAIRLARLEAEHAYCPQRIRALEDRLSRYDGQRTPTNAEWARARESDPQTWDAIQATRRKS